MIRVALADDKTHNRNIVKQKLQSGNNFELVLEAANGEEFLAKLKLLPQEKLPEVALIDMEMPFLDGAEVIAIASSLFPNTKFVVLTVFDDDNKIFRAIKAGACGYLLKEESSEVLTEMLINLHETGAGPISPSIAYKILQMVRERANDPISASEIQDKEVFSLSSRETEILQLMSKGLDYKQIGQSLFVSPLTIRKHISNIYEKLHVNSKAMALRIAFTKKLI